MNLQELLNITVENCIFIANDSEYLKHEEMKKCGSTKHYDLAYKYEGALLGLLKEDRKEIIKSFNRPELFLVYIDIITWNYNSIALSLAPYFEEKDMMLYNLEMYKLFEFFKKPFTDLLKINPNIIKDDINKKLIDPSYIEDIKLFPRFAMLCEEQVKSIPAQQKLHSIKAQLNLWNNTNNK